MRPIDVLCEEERLRRLSERMSRDKDENAEPARQRRAQSLVQDLVEIKHDIVSPSCKARRFEAVRVLEAGLEARWRAVLHDMRESDVPRQGNRSATGAPEAATGATAEAIAKYVLDPLSASAREVPRQQAPVPAPSPEDLVRGRGDPQLRLSDALDYITVRSVVSFRGLVQVPAAVEGITLAVLRFVASASDSAETQPTAKSWDEARRVLLKPGHFVSSLRKFPYAAEQGQVPEEDVCFAEETLLEVPPREQDLAVHELAPQLHEWLQAALDAVALAQSRLQVVASPARATRAPARASPAPNAYPSSEPTSPALAPSVVGRAVPEIDAKPSLIANGYPAKIQYPGESAEPEPPLRSTSQLQLTPQTKALATGARSPSPKPLRRPSGSGGPAPRASAPGTNAGESNSRSAGFNVSWSTLAEMPQAASVGSKVISAAPAPSSSAALGGRQARNSVSGVSPGRRASPSPPPSASFAMSQPKHASSSSRASPSRAAAPASKASSIGTLGSYSYGGAPATRPRQSLGGGAASPMPAAKRQGKGEVEALAVPHTTRSTSARASLARPRSSVAVAKPARGSTALASTNGSSSPALPTPGDFASMRIQLEQEKKEVKQIRALESQLKWGLEREERRQTEEERREEARAIMEWRETQAKEMKDYVDEKSREQRIQDLMESKQFQEFKREWKQAVRAQEIERIKAQLAEDMDNAHWQVELQKAIAADRQLALQERLEAAEELRELKEKEKVRQKVQQDEERAHDLVLDYAHQANQISAEKEELLRNIQMLRSRQKAPASASAARTGSAFWPGNR
eukprot:TRINITY_DN15036_c0_g1_i1.p1 TRINITY_DN15036_c0_g1~~TRINITY_DN15036_c0_g1_i1.p1  ORF type:complete len:804 (-),score=171.27 TRINITY_DN15036_c0_g1_i1:53-2464(-)